MLPVEQLCHFPPTKACWFQNSKSDGRTKPNPKVSSNSLYRKGTSSVIMTFSIRDNFLWTCQSSTDCWSLISSTKMEHISLLSASPKAEKLSFSLYSSSNQNSKSWGRQLPSAPQPSGADRVNLDKCTNKAEHRPNLHTKLSSPPPYITHQAFFPLCLLKGERRDGL